MEQKAARSAHHPSFRASVTCITCRVSRIPGEGAERPVTEAAPQCAGLDSWIPGPECPMPLDIAGKDNCAVGRLRQDCAMENGLCFWVVGDQLLKGAALNAVQIAEVLVREG